MTPPDKAAQLAEISGWLGVAVTAGCFVHCLGDALTESGCPFLLRFLWGSWAVA